MAKMSQASQFWTYVAECFRVLYWSYFKPYTFASWLRDIHPQLKPTDNPFAKRAEFRNNPRLHRYAEQVWWLTAVVPLLAVLVVGSVYTGSSSQTFNWFRSSFLLLVWLINLFLAQSNNYNLNILLFLVSGGVILLTVLGVVPDVVLDMIPGMSGLVFGMVWGVAWGVAWGVTLGVASGVASGALGLLGLLGVAWGMARGVGSGVVFGVIWGVVFGMFSGMVSGVLSGVAYTLGVLRVYFWFPELLWMLILVVLSRRGDAAHWLCYLPPRFDERIILPLPRMGQMIVEAYQENPSAARETIAYLITSTNQQNVAAQAIAGIAVDIPGCPSPKQLRGSDKDC